MPALAITVSLDPRITFLTLGVFDFDSTLVRPIGTVNWKITPNGLFNHYTYLWNNFTGPPGNNATVVNTSNGTSYPIFWYLSGDSGIWSHGVYYDQFVVTGNNTFKLHRYGVMVLDGQVVNGEYWEFFKRQ